MKLHLLRHAKTEAISITGRDSDRKLVEKGIKQAERLADFLKNLKNIEIHCSSSKRTRETFEIISKNLPEANVHFTSELYLCSHYELLNYINNLKTNKDLLILGHNNGLSDFATQLTGNFINLKTAGYVQLDSNNNNWSELSFETANLVNSYRPEVD